MTLTANILKLELSRADYVENGHCDASHRTLLSLTSLIPPEIFEYSRKIYGDFRHFVIGMNGPFAVNGHMVQKIPCWRANYALGHPKQRKFKFDLMKSLCFGCPVRSLLSSKVFFVPCDH